MNEVVETDYYFTFPFKLTIGEEFFYATCTFSKETPLTKEAVVEKFKQLERLLQDSINIRINK